jgi:hypothetical protein
MIQHKIEETTSQRAQGIIHDKPQGEVVLSPDPTDTCTIAG